MNNADHIPQEVFERIEHYILGTLTQPETERFEQDLEDSEALSLQYKEVKSLLSGIEEASLREELERFHGEMDSSENKGARDARISIWRWLVAAVVSLCIGAGVWLLLSQEEKHVTLYAEFYQEDPGLITAMSSEASYDFDRGMVDYKIGNYREAIARWELLKEARPENDTLLYFIGSAFLAQGSAEPAIAYFQQVTGLGEGGFLDDAYWYLGLAYLKEGREEEAIEALKQTKHPQRDRLLQLIREK